MGMNYTRYLALPKDWLRYQELDSNDEVKVDLTGEGNLLIIPIKRKDNNEDLPGWCNFIKI